MRDIRKLCVGPNYKDSVIYEMEKLFLSGSHHLHLIKYVDGNFLIFIEQDDVIVLWKEFTSPMPISIEYNINF